MRKKNLNPNCTETETAMLLVKQITAAVPVEYIYVCSPFFSGQVKEMLIMVSNKHFRILNELIPVLNIVFNGQGVYGYRIFHTHEVLQALQNGSLFFYDACKAQNCLFSKTGSFLNRHSLGSADNLAQRVKLAYGYETARAEQFLSGAKFYRRQQHFEHGTFMLHQFFDLLYRSIEVLVIGASKKTHRIGTHQLYIKPYLPELAELFNLHNEEEAALLHVLDEAYLAVRYENNYKVNRYALANLFAKAALLQHSATQVYQGVMDLHFSKQQLEIESAV
ncbi:hypothetical protein ACS5PU_11790 [Pedobacter sp. GSP4]|uniref:hypothetical protein n=1 Tax=Pedobacter sp. GSP4 TaxID=3453716 RepID=UPI003EEF6822